MKNINLIILYLLALLLFSCRNDKKEQLAQLVEQWQGKQIVFPEQITFTRYLDPLDYQIPQAPYKVLVYVDSIGCMSCKLQLPKWKELIRYTDSVSGRTVPFLFFFHPQKEKEMLYLLKRDRFEWPVCIDRADALNSLNHFPSDIRFQTFLLDQENRVKVIGNPIHNVAVKDLYLKYITGKESPTAHLVRTTAEAEQREIDLGIFDLEETKEVTFRIQNTGQEPLVIVDVSTTCGCTAATYDKQPAAPGERLEVNVRMTPKDTGFFDETITVKCNTKRPVSLKLKGQVR